MIMDLMDQDKPSSIVYFHPNKTGIQIRIGSENNHLAMENCSVITATYSIGEEQMDPLQLLVQLEWIINE